MKLTPGGPIGVSGLLVAGLLAACGQHQPPAVSPRPVIVTTVAPQTSATLAAYAGEVRARHETDLAFRIGGKIVERRFNLGDTVKRGDVLARLDAGDAQLAATAGAAQVAAAEAELALARAEYERARHLAAKNFVSGTAVDTRQTQWQAAAARLNQARAQAGVAGNQLGYTTLIAGHNGVITAAPGEAGQVVAAGQAVVRLADPTEREILIHIPESRIAGVKPGLPALIRPWSAPESQLAGQVREVAASADNATRTFAVRVTLADGSAPLRLGTTAAVGFPGEAEAAVKLPLAAVLERDGQSRVWIVGSEGKVSAKTVGVAAFQDSGILVKSGLASGDRVVVVGAHALSDGMVVKAIDERSPPALDAKR